jgi:hypothetical protein
VLKNATQLPAVAGLAADAPHAIVPFAGLAATRVLSAPIGDAQGTAVPAAARTRGLAAAGTAATNQGSPPRGTPV